MNSGKSNSYSYDPELAGFPSSHKQTPSRAYFVNKVLNYVSIQLAITAIIASLMYKNRESVIQSLRKDPGLVWFPVIVTFISLILMYMIKSCQKPMFWVFTVACSCMVGTTVLQYAPQTVFMAVITTMLIVWMVNGYSYWCVKRNKDLGFLEPLLGTGICMLIIVIILNAFIQSSLLHSLITIFGVILFTGFLLFDLNRLYDNGDKDHLEDPMLAAVNIYLDIINLFVYLLELYDQWCGEKS